MRDLNECKAEIFIRSEKRIKERRNAGKSIVSLCLVILFVSLVIPTTMLRFEMSQEGKNADGVKADSIKSDGGKDGCDGDPAAFLDGFSFSLTWGCYGISSYDSETGKLVKTKDATNPEDYITTYYLTNDQKQKIYDLISDLDVTAYPDTYDPHPRGFASKPSMTLILSVKNGTVKKTITAEDIALTYESDDIEGQRFLSICKAISDILTETDEWKSLPEYEFFYD